MRLWRRTLRGSARSDSGGGPKLIVATCATALRGENSRLTVGVMAYRVPRPSKPDAIQEPITLLFAGELQWFRPPSAPSASAAARRPPTERPTSACVAPTELRRFRSISRPPRPPLLPPPPPRPPASNRHPPATLSLQLHPLSKDRVDL